MHYLAILGPLWCITRIVWNPEVQSMGNSKLNCEKGLGHMHVVCGVSARPVVSQLVVDLKGASSSSAGRMLWCYHNYMYGWPNRLVPSLGHGTRDRVSGVGGAPLRRGHGPGRSVKRVRGTWWSPWPVLGTSCSVGAGILGPARGGPAFN